MKDPTRLLDASVSELELHLLRAGASEQPPSAARQRLAERLGASDLHNIPTASGLPPTAAGKLSPLLVGMVAVGITLAGVAWIATRSTMPPEPKPVATQVSPPTTVSAVPGDDTAAPATQDPHPLALEIARIDSIRRFLASDHPKAAIAALSEYQRDFPSGALHQEADVLSIEAHQKAGDRRRARVLAVRFLANNPDSPHSARVRDLLDLLGPDAR